MARQGESSAQTECAVVIAPVFVEYLAAAAARLQVLFPHAVLDCQSDVVRAGSVSAEEAIRLRRDLLHLLYREKVYAETLDMRRALIRAVTQR